MTIRVLFRPLLAALLLPGWALADRTPENLRGFRSVCVNAGFEEQGKENEAIRTKLIERLYAALESARIKAADSPCQEKGLSSSGQLNLYFSFISTQDGRIFNSVLDGWLSREGPYKGPTLWQDNIFGSMEAGGGALEAADLLDELLEGFVKDWQSVH
ncbi:hypothetical protein [Deinococcus koreensis]|uniref:Uncharacterized protein n=1 Tax=Deinococcus koreensis TaxID=2054903 RepID=A0A2K3UVE0_9DEIO|nr:hypothetical protein [Deinococcus koreensis]PNY80498.1 hypothetical protein CVO96_03170 [Deinococcus koreensis]